MDERIELISDILKTHQNVLEVLINEIHEGLLVKLINDNESLNGRLELLNMRVRALERVTESSQPPNPPSDKESHEMPTGSQKEVEELHAQLMLELEEFRRNTP